MDACVIIVPCYNEARRLKVAAFLDYLKRTPAVSILFVNDGSTDQTLEILAELRSLRSSQVQILDYRANCGKAEAVRRGMLKACQSRDRSDYIGFWDADLATPLEAINDFLGVFRARPQAEMVFGSRVKLLGRDIARRPTRHYLGRMFASCVSLVLDLPVYDTQCSAKIFRANGMLEQILKTPFLSRWIFDVELIARRMEIANSLEYPHDISKFIYEYPLNRWTDVAGSKLRATDFLKAARELWMIQRKYLRSPSFEFRATRRNTEA